MAKVKLRGGIELDAPDHLFPVQRELFIEEYLIDFDSERAALAVGIQGSRQSLKNLDKNPSIRADIKARYEQRYGELGPRAFRLTNELTKLAFSDIRSLFDENGNLLPVSSLPNHIAACVSSVDVVKRVIYSKDGQDEVEYTHKIRLHDKVKAIQALQKQLGLIAPDVNIINNNTTINNSTIPLDKLPTWLKLVIINIVQGGSIPSNLETDIINNLSESLSFDTQKMITIESKPVDDYEEELEEESDSYSDSNFEDDLSLPIRLISAT